MTGDKVMGDDKPALPPITPPPRSRWQFGLVRGMVIVAVFGAALALSREYGSECVALALTSAAAFSGVVILASRKNAVSIVRTCVSAVAGAMFSLCCCSPSIIGRPGRAEMPYLNIALGAILGWVVGRVLWHMNWERKVRPKGNVEQSNRRQH